MIPTVEILIGDVRTRLRQIPDESVQAIVTSPPYWALRNYGSEPQIWGGDPKCTHSWKAEGQRAAKPDRSIEGKDANGSGTFGETRGGQASKEARGAAMQFGQSCRCGAWLGELGLEPTPELFIEHSLEVFAECWRVLKKDGTMWLNYGDSYINTPGNARGGDESQGLGNGGRPHRSANPKHGHGLKPKDLVGMPWRVALALQQAGWYLRQDIIWHKPNPMPESTRDRCTKAHEYIFLLTKSRNYYFDQKAIREPVSPQTHLRISKHGGRGKNPKAIDTGVGFGYADEKPRTKKVPSGWDTRSGSHDDLLGRFTPTKEAGREEQGLRTSKATGHTAGWRVKQNADFSLAIAGEVDSRNRRSVWPAENDHQFIQWLGQQPEGQALIERFMSEAGNRGTVWTIATEAYSDAHYATYPRDLIRPCILAGTRRGDTVLDIFAGSGTTGQVALEYGRHALLIDVNPANQQLMIDRLTVHLGQAVLPLA